MELLLTVEIRTNVNCNNVLYIMFYTHNVLLTTLKCFNPFHVGIDEGSRERSVI